VSGTTAPDTEYTGIDYLLAYWLMRSVERQQGGNSQAE
jgi:hypothetical protein